MLERLLEIGGRKGCACLFSKCISVFIVRYADMFWTPSHSDYTWFGIVAAFSPFPLGSKVSKVSNTRGTARGRSIYKETECDCLII